MSCSVYLLARATWELMGIAVQHQPYHTYVITNFHVKFWNQQIMGLSTVSSSIEAIFVCVALLLLLTCTNLGEWFSTICNWPWGDSIKLHRDSCIQVYHGVISP